MDLFACSLDQARAREASVALRKGRLRVWAADTRRRPRPCPTAQVGLSEMKNAVEHTGGWVVQTDTFTNPIFKCARV